MKEFQDIRFDKLGHLHMTCLRVNTRNIQLVTCIGNIQAILSFFAYMIPKPPIPPVEKQVENVASEPMTDDDESIIK